jgi:uncharacterized protein YdeI (YjbR/CyaY-like superfamily)
MKWSAPHFDYKGMMCAMASFKNHAIFGFWKSTLVLDRGKIQDGAGQFGKLTSVADLPSDRVLTAYIRKAAKLNDDGVRVAKAPRRELPKPKTPPALAAALKKNKKAQAAWTSLSPSHVREYVEWITEAKGDDTRARRIATTLEWLSEGKSRNWKYMKKQDYS